MIRFPSLAALLFCIPVVGLAQTPSSPALTLEECVSRALAKNFNVEIQRFNTENARDAIAIAEAAFDPTLQATASTGASLSPPVPSSLVDDDGNIITTDRTRQDYTRSRAGYSQRITSGATVSASTALDRSKTLPSGSRINPAYDADISVSVRQPLLRGVGSTVNRAAIDRARIGLDRAQLDFKSVVLSVVRDVESAYYNLIFAREQLQVRRLSLELANQLYEENRTRRQTGVATDLDVLQAEVGISNARRNVLLAEQAVRDREDVLLQLIGQFEFDQPVGAVSFGENDIPPVSFDSSYRRARENYPDYASTLASIEQLRLDLVTAKNGKLPALDLGGALGFNTRERSYPDAATEVWKGEGYAWQLDLSLSVPWGLKQERARYRQAQTNLNREQARLQQVEQNVLVQVRSAVRAVETNLESVTISAKSTELSLRQYELEKARFDAGLSTARRVLEAQDDLELARVSELQAKVNLRLALANLNQLEGSTLERYNIVVD